MFLAANLVGWIGGDFVYRKVAAKNIITLIAVTNWREQHCLCFDKVRTTPTTTTPTTATTTTGTTTPATTTTSATTKTCMCCRDACRLTCVWHSNTHTQRFNGPLFGTTLVRRYQKKHSPTHTHPDHQPSFIKFLHLLRSIASSLFNLRAWQSFSTTSLYVLFGLPLVWSLVLHTFIHPIIIFFSQNMPIQSQPVLL